jgi:hypothetical protein
LPVPIPLLIYPGKIRWSQKRGKTIVMRILTGTVEKVHWHVILSEAKKPARLSGNELGILRRPAMRDFSQ